MKDGNAGSSSVYAAGGLALSAAAAMAYWQHYNDNVAAPPRLWIADGPLKERVLPHCSALLRPFAPTPWAANRHAQTVLGFMRGLTLHTRYNRQLILAVDGATLGLDWFDACDAAAYPAPPDAPVLIVCHGINGGSHEGYAKWACSVAVARGWRAVVLNYRGCNGLPFTAPRGYAATMSHDVFTAVYSVKARFPSAPLLAVGYSLGGLKLTKYLAEADAGLHVPAPWQPRLFSGSGLAAAAVVSSPVDLRHSSAKLADRTSVSFLYNLAVAYKLREHIATHRADIAAHTRFDVDAALSAWTVGELEERGLPASMGFKDRYEYMAAASSPDYIPAITTPTLLLLAEDDPFLGVVPDVECSRNPATLLALTRRGGHVAFLQGAWPLGRAYMDDAVIEFFAATLEHYHHTPQPPSPRGSSGGGDNAAAAAAGAMGGTGASAPAAPAAATTAAAAAPAVPLQASPAAGIVSDGSGSSSHAAAEPPVLSEAMRAGALAAAYAASGARRHNGGGVACEDASCHGGENCKAHRAGHHHRSHPNHHDQGAGATGQHGKGTPPGGTASHGHLGGPRPRSPPSAAESPRAGKACAAAAAGAGNRSGGSAGSPSGRHSSSREVRTSRGGSSGGGGGGPAASAARSGQRGATLQRRPDGTAAATVAQPLPQSPRQPPSADRFSEQLRLMLVLQQQLDRQQRAAAGAGTSLAGVAAVAGQAAPPLAAAVAGSAGANATVTTLAEAVTETAPAIVAARTSGVLRSRL